ncbi:MAG: response regulator [Proteobacteria bacterium]|nr:response regulator [Pseudomonadota bacterium]MBU1686664.1 response regulator [Pseudomonadota bacterium]
MSKLKLLIAEDSKLMQFFYESELSAELYELKIVSDGEQALAEYSSWQPDIILLDMLMPVMNGYLALKAIRERFKDKSVTIIMATSSNDKDDVIACAKVGIQGYIVKPFEADDVNKAILKYHQQKK